MDKYFERNTAELVIDAYKDSLKTEITHNIQHELRRYKRQLELGRNAYFACFFNLKFSIRPDGIDGVKRTIPLRFEIIGDEEYLIIYNKDYSQKLKAIHIYWHEDVIMNVTALIIALVKMETGISEIQNKYKILSNE